MLILCLVFALYTVSVYLYCDPAIKKTVVSAQIENGKKIWQEKNCQSCHQLYGLGGYMGPDLTNVAQKGPAYMHSFMQYGTKKMPDFNLTETEINELTAFLKWVDDSGISKVQDSSVTWTGSYHITPRIK